MSPSVVEASKVSIKVFLAILVTPEHDRLIRKSFRRNKFAGLADWEGVSLYTFSTFMGWIICLDFHPEPRALATSYIDGRERILKAETTGQIRSARDVSELDRFRESFVVHPFE